ncbi:hypothetical protein K2173_025001 [Erythroxylum novogranatense]|uniref:Disease resistance N-terminal domain-containing protein n=1 Tax=Erythroxylum novogranatense TaxID=1862640 RepID=A0AAV8UFT9_9ROSI|nr:hypothetical protein K2173_025001 [Erythroxylum novogranatense]
MAEAILYGIANEIIKILGLGALQQIGIWWGVNDELKKLENTISTTQAVLLDAEQRQTQDFQIKGWLRKLQDVVYDADDLLDDFYTEALIRKTTSQTDQLVAIIMQIAMSRMTFPAQRISLSSEDRTLSPWDTA